jgi:hypothetical protein
MRATFKIILFSRANKGGLRQPFLDLCEYQVGKLLRGAGY